jgi:hypothetical protein
MRWRPRRRYVQYADEIKRTKEAVAIQGSVRPHSHADIGQATAGDREDIETKL